METEQLYSHPIINTCERYKRWKVLFLIIIIILLCGVIGWQFYEIETINTLIPREEAENYSNFTAIALSGDGQVVRAEQDLPIHGWNIEFQYGDISFHHNSEVHIRIAGVYYVYLQMYFYLNGESYSQPMKGKGNAVMDIGIINNQLAKRYLSATVPLMSCMNVCTRHLSGLLHLKKGYILSIGTATPGIHFKMIKEKTLFDVILLHRAK